MATDRRPVIRGPEEAWQRLGELLQLRRAELGYRRRPAFTRDRGINIRLVTDVENAYRPNTFLTPTLREIAQAYAVTYDSLVAVILGHDDELIPGDVPVPLTAAGMPALPPPPFDDPVREAADLPYVRAIWGRFLDLPRRVTDPTGEQMFPGSPDDAKAWDGIAGRWDDGERMWMIADMQRRGHGRPGGSGNAGTGTDGA